MTSPELFHFDASNFEGAQQKITIASGPVIFNEAGEVLLHRGHSNGKFQFIGGRISGDISIEQNVIQQAHDALGITIAIMNQTPFIVSDMIERDGKSEQLVLIHYAAEITAGELDSEDEWGWFSLDKINEMMKNDEISSPNILLASKHFVD